MPKVIEIIYDYDGYKDPGIKNVELNRVNGYKTIIKKEGKEIMEEYKLVNLSGVNARKILECADQENIDVEAIIDFIKKLKEVSKMSNEQTNDERFTEEEKKVQEFMAKPENKGISYRDAVIASLDRTEPKPKKEPTKEEITKRENLKAVENYILARPGATYKEAVRVVLRGEELTLEEKLIDEYLEKNPGSDYKTAVIESLSLLEKEKEE